MKQLNTILLLEIGSDKIIGVLCKVIKVNNKNTLEFITNEEVKTQGIFAGKIVDRSKLLTSLKSLKDNIIQKSGVNIKDTALITSSFDYNSKFITATNDFTFTEEITQETIDKIKQKLNYTGIVDLNKEQIIHIIPIIYKVNNKQVADPIGLKANKLEIKCHVLTIPVEDYQEIKTLLEKLGLDVFHIIAGIRSSIISSLTTDEQKLTTMTIDIGKGNIQLGIMKNNTLIYCHNFSGGTSKITKNLMKYFNINYNEAVRIKNKYGVKKPDSIDFSQTAEINILDAEGEEQKTTIDLYKILNITYKSFEKIVNDIKLTIKNFPIEKIILVGGVKMLGVENLFKEKFDKLIRIAKPEIPVAMPAEFKDEKYSSITGAFIYMEDFIKDKQLTFSYSTKIKERIIEAFNRFLKENFE